MGPRPRPQPRSKLDLLIWGLPLLGLLIVAGLWALVLGNLRAEQAQVEREIEQRVRGLTQAFEEYTRRSLQQVDQISAFVAHEFEERGGEPVPGASELGRLLKLGLGDLPGVVALAVADARGQVHAVSLPMAQARIDDREYFARHRDVADGMLWVGRPEQGRFSERWIVPLSRRLQRGDGGFAGVLLVAVDPRYFTDFYRASQFGQTGMVSLMGMDQVLRARRSGERVWFGETAGANLMQRLARWPEGSYVARSGVDGIERRLAYKSLHGFALVAVAGLGIAEEMAPFEAHRRGVLQAAAAASATLLLSFGALSLAAARLRRSQASRERAWARFEAASDASLDAFWLLQAERDERGSLLDFRFVHCNDRGARLLGRTKMQILGRLRSELLGARDDERHFELYCQALESRMPAHAELAVAGRGGAELILHHQVVPVGDGVAMTTRDVTEQRRYEREILATQEALRGAEQRLRTITDNVPALIAYIDSDLRGVFLNAMYREWFGADPATMQGRPMREVIGAELFAQREPWLRRALAGERVSFELEFDSQGRTRAVHNDYIPDIAPDGRVLGLYALSQDISTLKAVERELLALAREDSLTGLANRHRFEEVLPQALARAARSGAALALMFLDVDKFKSINDELGHATGDAVLKEFAQRLRQVVRGTDTVARLAGDEFVIILEELHGEQESQLVAGKLAALIAEPFELEGLHLAVTSSIGIAYHAGGPMVPTELLARADRALYVAKGAGRNTFRQVVS